MEKFKYSTIDKGIFNSVPCVAEILEKSISFKTLNLKLAFIY